MPPPALGEALEAPSSSPLRKPPSTQTPPGAPGASRSSPLCVGCRGPRHTAPRRAAGSSPSSTSPGQPHALRPSTRASRSPEGRPGPRTAPPDATLQGSPERGRPPAAGHVHSHSNTRLRPASAPRPRLAWRLPGQKAQPGPRRRHLRPRARAMFEKEGASQRPGPARAPRSRPPAPPPLTRRPRDQRRRSGQHEEEQPGTRSSGRRLHGPAATACGPARPPPRLYKPCLAPPPQPPRRPRSGPL